MDKTPTSARHLISNMASNTQQFGIRGVDKPRMVNEISAVDNLRLENQLIKLTLLVRQLAVRQHQPSITARVYGIYTSMELPTNMCPILQDGYQYEKQSYQSWQFDNQYGKQPFRPRLNSTIPTTATTENATSRQFRISGRTDEAVSIKQFGVPTKH
ncbi:hypothetical protein CR513_43522, partial [Mucuna pruriens]